LWIWRPTINKKQAEKTYVVTGATSGIGLALVEQLLERGFNVIGIGRSPERCTFQRERLLAKCLAGRVAYSLADLSVQAEIRKVARGIEQIVSEWRVEGLDGLINNAGTFTFWQTLTPEGFETQWAVNHLAPFLLTHELLPLLSRSPDARVITVSSSSHYGAKLNWMDIQLFERYNPLRAYKQTKLANVLFTAELNRRLGPESPVRAIAVDPGLVNTGIGEKAKSRFAQWVWSHRRRRGVQPAQSAAEIMKPLLDPSLRGTPAIYWKHGKPKRPDPYTLDEDYGWRLWEISARMTGVRLRKER